MMDAKSRKKVEEYFIAASILAEEKRPVEFWARLFNGYSATLSAEASVDAAMLGMHQDAMLRLETELDRAKHALNRAMKAIETSDGVLRKEQERLEDHRRDRPGFLSRLFGGGEAYDEQEAEIRKAIARRRLERDAVEEEQRLSFKQAEIHEIELQHERAKTNFSQRLIAYVEKNDRILGLKDASMALGADLKDADPMTCATALHEGLEAYDRRMGVRKRLSAEEPLGGHVQGVGAAIEMGV